jgi:hypothetical protein
LGTAYTPGLRVSPRTTIEKLRRLPLKGTVLVREGEVVTPNTVVARTELPGLMQTIKVAERMGIEASEVAGVLKIKVGDTIQKDDVIAETKGLFGKFFRSEFRSPVGGKVELISPSNGHVGVREAPTPVEKDAYIRGTIAKVIPGEGVIVRCEGALVQGIFGVGGERLGEVVVVTDGPDKPITDATLTPAHAGKIVIGGSNVSGAALRKAAQLGIIGIVCGGVVDRELMDYLAEALDQPGYDIGVAITGQEPIAFTLIVTEGFGTIDMAKRTFALFQSLQGKTASINGATQIRAGVIRPEVVVPLSDAPTNIGNDDSDAESGQLGIGTPIRVIREPYFGILGSVTGLPEKLQKVESETMVRVLEAKLEDGRTVTVPRANVEIIETV